MEHDRRYRILDGKTIVKIRLNKRRQRGRPGGAKKNPKFQAACNTKNNVNLNNLVQIPLTQEPNRHKSQVKLGVLNARSVRNKDVLIKDYLTDSSIDICVISETWLQDYDDYWIKACELNRDGYSMVTSHRMGRPGGGLACVCRNRFKVKQLSCGTKRSFEYALWNIMVNNSDSVNLVGIYHPPPSTKNPPNSVFIDEFSVFLSENIMHLPNLVITGDFNMRVNDSEDHDVNVFTDTMHSLGLDQHVYFQTHNQGNTVDLIFTECFSKVNITGCIQGPYISDHCAVTCITSLKKSDVERQKVKFRKLKDMNGTKIIKEMNLEKILQENDINDIINQFDAEATKAMNKLVPVKEKTVTIREKNPWYTEEIRQQKRVFRNRERIWKRYRSKETWLALQEERRKYKKMLITAKHEKIKNLVNECGSDSKRLYKLVDEITGKKSENKLPADKSDRELADEFANFFMEKILKIRDSLKDQPTYSPLSHGSVPSLDSFKELTDDEVKKIICSMATKSCEIDSLPTKFIKDGLHDILPVITKIVNVSLKNGSFANAWKTATVRPLLKKPDLDLVPKNYRPVSNLSFISKVVEKAMLQQFNAHCEANLLMPDYQSAYRTNYSCETAITRLVNDILWAMENQNVAALSAIDLSAAFDTVDHNILLEVLKVKFGISGTALDWFNNYLRPRYCKVNVGCEYSSPKELYFSVPQGSCAGPVLYLVYASTMREIVPTSISLYGYADDHALMNCFKSGDLCAELECIDDIENTMENVKEWMDCNRLKMNSTKTEFILFGNKKQLQKCETKSINVAGEIVQKTSKIKYLGVQLDESLSMKSHIANKCRVAMLNIQRIKFIRPSLSVETCQTLVQGLVISHLDYANATLAGLPSYLIGRVQKVQNTAAKLILNKNKFDSSTECMKELHWLPIRARIEFKVLMLVYKCLQNKAPLYLRNLIKKKECRREGLRSSEDDLMLEVPHTLKKIYASRSFSVYGPELWNRLPYNIRSQNTLQKFKSDLKTHLFTREYNA